MSKHPPLSRRGVSAVLVLMASAWIAASVAPALPEASASPGSDALGSIIATLILVAPALALFRMGGRGRRGPCR